MTISWSHGDDNKDRACDHEMVTRRRPSEPDGRGLVLRGLSEDPPVPLADGEVEGGLCRGFPGNPPRTHRIKKTNEDGQKENNMTI